MNNFFDQAFEYLLSNEGMTYTNDPRDPGGPTKYGITQRSLEASVGRIVTASEIKDMSVEVAKIFYRKNFWLLLNCSYLEKIGVAISLFDTAVLYGPGTAAKMAQRAVSICGATLKFDGIIGEESVKLLNLVKQKDFLEEFYGQILARIDSVIEDNPSVEVYRTGWTNRAKRILTLDIVVPVIT